MTYVYFVPGVSELTGDTNMTSVTREIEEEEAKSIALEQKLKQDLAKYKVRSNTP